MTGGGRKGCLKDSSELTEASTKAGQSSRRRGRGDEGLEKGLQVSESGRASAQVGYAHENLVASPLGHVLVLEPLVGDTKHLVVGETLEETHVLVQTKAFKPNWNFCGVRGIP